MISFPPHTTHKLQPLDKTYFGPLKQYYGQPCDRWMVNHPGKRSCFYAIATLFGEAFAKASTLEKGVAGFSSYGLWSFNPDVFTEADFVPSVMMDDGNEHIASTSDATSPASPTTRATPPQAVTFTSDATSAPSNATACVTSLKAYVLSVFLLPKAGPRAGKHRTQSSELLTFRRTKICYVQNKLNWARRRRGALVGCLSRSRELHKGKRAPANGKARQPLAESWFRPHRKCLPVHLLQRSVRRPTD